jgi:Rod binding domain-containing protein
LSGRLAAERAGGDVGENVDYETTALMPRESATELYLKRADGQRSAAVQPGSRRVIEKTGKLYEACVEFEALFIKQMLSAMRKSVQKTGLLDGGMAEDIFEDMLYDEYAKSMARNAGFGLADTVYLHLTTAQQAAVHSP